jgi:phosphoribosylanthranilate isomerase
MPKVCMTKKAKICGIKTREALDAAIDGGADYVGLVFCSKSPRHLELGEARTLAEYARGKVKIVALTVDADDAALGRIVDEIAPDFLQLHGHEAPERVAAIKQKFGRPVIKAVPVATPEDAARAHDYADVADLILFDAKAPPGAVLPGGNGVAFDWLALEEVSRRQPFMLSGGLTPETVANAIRVTGAGAVDVSSGVESAPGVKDPELIRRFLDAVKTAKQA